MPTPPPGWPRLASCLALSAALHLLLGGALAGGGSGAHPTRPPARLTVHLPRLAEQQGLASPAVASLPATSGMAEERVPPATAQAELTPAGPTGRPASDTAAPDGDRPGPAMPALPGLPRYYPSEQLDIAPFPHGLIALDAPVLEKVPGSGTLRIELWIAASGQVDRVDVHANPLPQIFSDVAQQAFAAARFDPGMKDGHAVASHLYVEVDYAELGPPPVDAHSRPPSGQVHSRP